MGCCWSSQKDIKMSENESIASSSGIEVPITNTKPKPDTAHREGYVQGVFNAKRANVFAEGINDDERKTYQAKRIPKTAKQSQTIRAALASNYVFSNVPEKDLIVLIESMNIVEVQRGENVIKQGEEGDFFYIIDKGTYTVIVDNKQIAQLGEGKSFGELALLYNSPRQATIRAEAAGTLFSLDRDSFRHTLAQGSATRIVEIKQALARVPLLQGLTDEQFEKLTDSVELVPYEPGDVIIRKGTEGNIFYMIKEGTVKVTEAGAQFSDSTLTAGDFFGELALLKGEPRAATITALSKVTLLALDRETFNSLLGPLKEVIDYNTNMRVLSSIKLFDKLTKNEKFKIARSFDFETYPAGSTIIKEGDQGKKFYILKEGSAKVTANGIEVGQLTAGQYFGELALLDDEVRKASVVATKDCETFVLDRQTFTRILGSLQQVINRVTNDRRSALRTAAQDSSEPSTQILNLQFSDLKTLAVLGSGTFGRVTLVQNKGTNQVYALKTMLKSEIVAHKQQANVVNEKNIMIQCNHPFILKLHQTFKDPSRLYMLLEFIQGGELFGVLHTPQYDGVPDAQAKFYAGVILLGLAYLHSKDIAYRDMKPENCLIDRQGYPKLVDFGFAKIIQGKSFTLCGTPEYLAPELVLGRGHTRAVDYWAFGILCFEMAAGYSPFSDPQGNDQVVICKNIVNGKLVFPNKFNADCKEVVKKLLVREVQNRLGNLKGGTDDIKNMKWFHGFDFDAVYKKQMRAPWIPKINSATDTSNFDPYATEEPKTNYVDHGNWDRDF